jgi:aminopeptidase N
VTTDAFIDLAEDISGQDLDPLFETWLFTPGKPDLGPENGPEVALRTPSSGKTSRVPSRR